MGMNVKKIHACPNDCVLFRNEHEDLDICPKCGASRYKRHGNIYFKEDKKRPPAKVIWYLPIMQRFRCLFVNKKDAKLLRWHVEGRKSDGMLRHPGDSPQWRTIDGNFPEFTVEPRNLRLGLCANGMNPYRTMSSNYSTWPVLLTVYNLPPWLYMKRKYIMLTLLISGPKEAGNNIDVYLQPLIKDLKLLWDEGVTVYDAYSQSDFTLRAMIFYTISDFPTYGNLSWYTTKGAKACTICEEGTIDQNLKYCKKNVYMGHRAFLHSNYPYRRRDLFFGIFHIGNTYRSGTVLILCILKKNVYESIIGTLLNIPRKTKDGIKANLDMEEMGIRKELAPQITGKRLYLPSACYTLSKKVKISFCECLSGVKFPSGYSSNIKRLVLMQDLKLMGLKSHDCHVLMQHLLPIAIQGILPKYVRLVITK
ncbi:uncharacterized protein LOC141660855 [Apium graveolens]|uniref:uncharacterized protein LOC141660855 n=1 Tax=Apium graveolens TaxID=4045 RepID=UPI003D7B6782